MKKGLILFLSVLFFQVSPAAALGVLYWHHPNVNFQPGLQLQLNYLVHNLPLEKEVRVYAEGDLAQYVEVSPEKLVGGGGFTATIRLPAVIEKPGPHILHFVVTEVAEDVGGIGTTVTIRVPFTIHVPYPGKYAEAHVTVGDINIGESLPVAIEGANLGTENNTISARFDILSSEGKAESFDLGNLFVKAQENFVFRKKVDTVNYKSGNYKVAATIDYGSPLFLEADFRIGSLFVTVMNYTARFMKESINKFDIEAESHWNNLIDEAYAEVSIFNATSNISKFKTPSEGIERWGRKTLTGFFDTHGVGAGSYTADITLTYRSGKKTAQTSTQVTIEVVEGWWVKYKSLLVVAAVSVLLFIISVFFASFLLIHKFKKKRR